MTWISYENNVVVEDAVGDGEGGGASSAEGVGIRKVKALLEETSN